MHHRTAGKFLNEFTADPSTMCPRGWTIFDALTDPYTYLYYTPGFSLNCGPTTVYPGNYSTDVIGAKAEAYIR